MLGGICHESDKSRRQACVFICLMGMLFAVTLYTTRLPDFTRKILVLTSKTVLSSRVLTSKTVLSSRVLASKTVLSTGNASCTGNELAQIESKGFINEPIEDWRLRRQIHHRMVKLEKENSKWCESPCVGKKWFAFHYEPTFSCSLKERIGKWGDGGKWICNPHQIAQAAASGKGCLVYSIGSSGEFSFEEAVLQHMPTCNVHTFDPGRFHAPSPIQYHAWAIGDKPPQKNMQSILAELGHAGKVIDILKIDCEGCEWNFFQHIFNAGAEIRQLVLELHWGHSFPSNGNVNYPAKRESVERLFQDLTERGYVVFHKEPNTHACGGDCLEISFLKLSTTFGKYPEPAWCGA